ncbi:23S rRNA (guanosine(2251)-2'-O)-methyltransferase RlmB [Blastococcus sp. Marseille-P5729]|uniref:23S rRNA (guanosine(2251)-2'-O)-methyltransferase RlmB n=1 Tax=Blastococcus sp. Marseille-P5729 TaxID=2086582 RepID=UPI000D0E5358|nr:23S rRNA (guanosine(2251)-2'-O)-methyltransferase RlmB [Blastococcus sp. Marseille-P5729]
MPGNSQRKGAMRKSGTKKGQVVGSGGQRRKGLEGRGPTPRAEDRPNHKAYRRSQGAKKVAGRTSTVRRQSGGPELLVGRNPVVEALRAEIPATALYIAERTDIDDRVREAIKICNERGIPIQEVARSEMDRLTGGALHQGLGIAVPPFQYADPADMIASAVDAGQVPLLVALDGVQDPRNLGAVVRSAAAFGAHGVIVPERRAAGMTATAWRTSAGAAARLPIAQVTNLSRALVALQKAGVFVVGLAADGDVELQNLDMAGDPLCIVVGSEGKGLSRLVAEKCDQIVSIPMSGATESLNASVAASVTLWQVASARGAGQEGQQA